ncbi:MAG: SdiA-regulated domain-containing protein [Planctomycetota bacterium]|nr:SdiA-regulated domain-containing protein [Planctomycetota bacterium]
MTREPSHALQLARLWPIVANGYTAVWCRCAAGLFCILIAAVLPLFPACGQAQKPEAVEKMTQSVAGYDLSKPLRVFTLPAELREISGITAIDANTVACVQDEKGAIYFFDLREGRVVRRAKFGPKGDYEGLAVVRDEFFVLRSDGVLLRLQAVDDRFEIVQTIELHIGQKEFEGLACDRDGKQLIIAPKSVAKDEQDVRTLFAVDLAKLELFAAPLLSLRVAAVAVAARQLGVTLASKVTDKGKLKLDLSLRLSEVAVAPDTGDFWLLSGADRTMLVVDRAGKVKGLHQFAEATLAQPEGATFLPNGELVIASEGVDRDAVLHIYGKAK